MHIRKSDVKEIRIDLHKPCKVKVSRTRNSRNDEIISGEFIEEYKWFYLFQTKSGWKESFLKVDLNREYSILAK